MTETKETQKEVSVILENCGNPLGQIQYALSGSGKSYKAPWAVSIGYYENDKYQHDCTGSIVTENIVITAAHCTHEDKGDLFIQAGVLSLKSLKSTERRIIQTIEHPDYKPPQVYFDVALALLDQLISFNERISPVCLPTRSFPNSDFMHRFTVTIQGWGKDDNGDFGEDLTKIDLTVKKNSFCNKKYESLSSARKQYWFKDLLTPPMFCADSNLGDNIGTCYGDSGGPTMIQDEEGIYYILMGVVSGNPGECGRTLKYPDYFTFIGHEKILPWILSTIQKTIRFNDIEFSNILQLSSGAEYRFKGNVLGIYKQDSNLTNNNKPVWKHIRSNYVLYYDKEDYWTISWFLNQKYPASKTATIRSDDKGLVYLPTNGWQFWDGSSWIEDKQVSLSYEDPEYPSNVNVTRLNSTLKDDHFAGNFNLVPKESFNNRPVWKNSKEKYLFFSGVVWIIAETIGSEDKESVPVYGWDYTDEKFIWPNTNSLFIVDYPETLTLNSTGNFSNIYYEFPGVYRKVPGMIRNGRPVWEKKETGVKEKVLFYNENNLWSFWDVSSKNIFIVDKDGDIIQKPAVLASSEKGVIPILDIKWKYQSLSKGLKEDNTLSLTKGEPEYPQFVTVTSNKTGGLSQFDQYYEEYGIYIKLPGVIRYGRPVWEHFKKISYIFYSESFWLIGRNYDEDKGLFQSTEIRGLLMFPRKGWKDGKNMSKDIEDESLTLNHGGVSYPQSVNIVNLSSEKDKHKSLAGPYFKVKDIMNEKPVWKHSKSEQFVFNVEVESITSRRHSQWYIGKRIGNTDNSSVKIYGWQYSDENYVWPNNDTLYITNYPDTFNIQSTGAALKIFPDALGTFKMIPGRLIINERPQWKHSENNDISLYYTVDSYWIIRRRQIVRKKIIEDNITIHNKRKGAFSLLDNDWEVIADNFTSFADESLTFTEGEPEYPDIVTISSNKTDVNTVNHFRLMGIYRKVPNILQNRKPVWKHFLLDVYIYYDVFWRVSNNYKQKSSSINSILKGLVTMPINGWVYYDFSNTKKWLKDETMTFTKNGPPYPKNVKIENLSKKLEKYKLLIGNFKIIEGKENKKPIWKQESSDIYIFNKRSQWYIGDKIGNIDNSSVTIYGWQYSDENYIWPNSNTLYITNYPETFTIQSEGVVLEIFPEALGTYKIQPNITNSRPQWKHNVHDIFMYFSNDYYWTVRRYPNPEGDKIRLLKRVDGDLEFPYKDWKVGTNNLTLIDDVSLRIMEGEPEYPEFVTVESNNSLVNSELFDRLGIFKKLKVGINGKPIWKHVQTRQYIFFDKNNYWTIGGDYSRNAGSIATKSQGHVKLPILGWRYYGLKQWVDDETMTVTEKGPQYPKFLHVVSLSKEQDSFKHFTGIYNISEDRLNAKPIWKNEKLKKYVFNIKEDNISPDESQWYVGEKIGFKDNDTLELFGWQYSDENYIWPKNNTLYITNYPKESLQI